MSDDKQEFPPRFQGEHVGSMGDIKPAETAEEVVTNNTKAITVSANDSGMLVGKSLDEQWRLAKFYTSSGLLPSHYNKPEKVLTAMQFCYELGLRPLTGMRQIAIINGNPAMFGDLPLSLVLASGKAEYVREYLVDAKGEKICAANKNLMAKPEGAVCVSKRKGDTEERETVFTRMDAQAAGLLGKSGPWKQYEKRMLQMRARSQNLKDQFADVLSGVAIAEYDHNADEPPRDSVMPSVEERLQQVVIKPESTPVAPTVAAEDVEETVDFEPEATSPTPNPVMDSIELPPEEDKPEPFVMKFGRFSGMTIDQIPEAEIGALQIALKKEFMKTKNEEAGEALEAIKLYLSKK